MHLDGLSNLLKGRPLSGLHPGDLPFPFLDLWLENAGLKSYYWIQTGFSTIICLSVHRGLGQMAYAVKWGRGGLPYFHRHYAYLTWTTLEVSISLPILILTKQHHTGWMALLSQAEVLKACPIYPPQMWCLGSILAAPLGRVPFRLELPHLPSSDYQSPEL